MSIFFLQSFHLLVSYTHPWSDPWRHTEPIGKQCLWIPPAGSSSTAWRVEKPSLDFTDDSELKIQRQRFPLVGPSHASSELQDMEKILPPPVLSYQRSRSALFWGANCSIASSQDTATHTAAALRLHSVHCCWTEYIFIIHHFFLFIIFVINYCQ